ncbi:MAG: hypothetical protein AAGU74_07915 [Bacillota bacterium]
MECSAAKGKRGAVAVYDASAFSATALGAIPVLERFIPENRVAARIMPPPTAMREVNASPSSTTPERQPKSDSHPKSSDAWVLLACLTP